MPVRASFSFPALVAPRKGPQGIPVSLDFTGGVISVDVDFALEQANGVIDFIQSMYVDNKDNAQNITFTFRGSGYIVRVRAGQQGIWTVIVPDGPVAFTAGTTGGVVVKTIFMNVSMPPMTWGI